MDAQTGTGTNGKGKRRAKARMDQDKQEAVQQPKIIGQRIDELVRLKNAADDAAEAFSDGIKKAAEDSGYLASAVKKFVTARAGEKFEEEHRKVEQQLELFEEVGE
jgi:hypothetical protein